MARRRKSKNNSIIQVFWGVIALVMIIAVGENLDSNLLESLKQNIENAPLENVDNVDKETSSNENVIVDGNLVIDYINVGQGDSILIRQGQHAMLIDGGTTECKEELLNFLQAENIKSFDYIVGTHPHEDHIGSLDEVVNTYDFDTILFSRVTSNTKNFEELVTAVSNKGKKFTTPLSGNEYMLGDAKFKILAPSSTSYQSVNNYSIVIKLTYGNNSFLFTGDAETLSEMEILNSFDSLKSDVLKVGHHGSTTSTSKKFLNAVSPKYAVVSVGRDNLYNHPTKTTMDKLKELNIPVYRTDEEGTIECVSNGKDITFNVEPGSYSYMGD